MPLPHPHLDDGAKGHWSKAGVSLGEKSGLVTRLATSTNIEIMERISESVTSYATESIQETFKSDTVFDSFHHQAMIPISNRALLAGFLMLWLKKCVVPTLPYKVIIVDVACAAILLAYNWFLGLLPTMAGYPQRGL